MVLAASIGSGCAKRTDPTQARELFASTCARCHGADGTGGPPVSDGGPTPRNFHDHEFQRARTDEQLKLTIMNGKGTAMPAFGAAYTDAQIAQLVLYVRSFDGDKVTK